MQQNHAIDISGYQMDFPCGFDCKGTVASWAMVLVLQGKYAVMTGADTLEFSQGSLSLQQPGLFCHWQVPQDCEQFSVLWFLFDPYPHWRMLLDWPEAFPKYASINLLASSYGEHVQQALLRANDLLYSHWPNRKALAMNALESALLGCQPIVTATTPQLDARIEAVMAYLIRHAASPITMDDVVNASCLSRSRLNELFTQATGLPIMTFLERERLRRAANLLSLTNLAVKEIARMVSYEDPCHFSRRFHAVYGRSPLAYRTAEYDANR